MFEIVVSSVGVVWLSGEIDLSTVERLDAVLGPAVTEGGPITVDVSDVTFMDSSALNSILTAAHSLGDRGCVVIHGVNENRMTQKLFEITKIGDMRNIHVISHD